MARKELDRDDSEVAAATLERLCPEPEAQRWWARHVWQAIDVARSVAPTSYSVTLDRNFVRLNVGQVAVLDLMRGAGFYYTCAIPEIQDSELVRRVPDWAGYKAPKVPVECWRVDLSAIPTLLPELLAKNQELVRIAAGRRKKTVFLRSYSPGIVAHLKRLAGAGWNVSALNFADEVSGDTYPEGALRHVSVNAYERNPEARARCLAHYGSKCVVCGLDFGETYGPLAEGYIHVHHLRPLHEISAQYEVDPVADLRPVCPNCHSVIHLSGQTRTIDEVKALVEARRRPKGST